MLWHFRKKNIHSHTARDSGKQEAMSVSQPLNNPDIFPFFKLIT